MTFGAHSAGVVVVRKARHGCLYLLLRAYQYWDFPKGLVEEGEAQIEAAKREVEEESCITDLDFRWGEGFRETGPYGRGKIARYYVALTLEKKVELPINPELGHPEHDEFRWVSYQEGLILLGDRVGPVLQWAQRLTGCERERVST
ncbi:MAG: NUDIX domain-containing protein [Gammaproteobacteria bacterium]|nr:NUDIX domain-containing protein [Gammaproteobacteria bacterium]